MSNSRSGRSSDRYGSSLIRPGLLPGLLGAAATLAGLWASGTEWMITILFAVSILGAILVFFCIQALRVTPAPATRNRPADPDRRPLVAVLGVLLVIVVIAYNPVMPFVLAATGTLWQLSQVAAGAVFFVAGVMVKTPSPTQ